MPVIGWVEHVDVDDKFAAWTAAQLDQLHALGWTDTTAPVFDDDFFRDLTTLDLAVPSGVATLGTDGRLSPSQLPASVTGLDYASVAGMFDGSHTGVTVTYNGTTHKLTLVVSGAALDNEAVRDLVGSFLVAGNGITKTVDDPGDTTTLAVDLEYLQDQVAAIFNGSHTNITVTYDDTTGKLTLVGSGGGTPAADSITTAMLQAQSVTAAKVDPDEVPVYTADGEVVVDDHDWDAGTAATHGGVDDEMATSLAIVFDLWQARGFVGAAEDGTPVPIQATLGVDAVPAIVGDVPVMKPLSELGGGGGGTGDGELTKHTLYDPYPENARKFSAALADAVSIPAHAVCNGAIYGDSVTENAFGYYVDAYRRILARFNGGAKPAGVVSGSPTTLATNNYQFAVSVTGTPGAGDNAAIERGLTLAAIQLAPGAKIILQDVFNATASVVSDWMQFLVTKVRTGGTTLKFWVDGVSAGTVTTTDGTIPASPGYDSGRVGATWTGALDGHTVEVENIGANSGIFDLVYIGDQRERLRIWNGGRSGKRYADFLTATNPGPLQTAKNVGFDLILAAFGINDYGDGATPVATLGTNLAQFFSDARAAVPDVSCGCIIPYAAASRADWGTYVTAMKSACGAVSVPWVDMSWVLQTNAATTDPRDLVTDAGGHIHQNASFGLFYATELAKFTIGDGIDWLSAITALLTNGYQKFVGDGTGSASFISRSYGSIVGHFLGQHAEGAPGAPTASASGRAVNQFAANAYGATGRTNSGNPNAILRWRTAALATDSAVKFDLVGLFPRGGVTPQENWRFPDDGGLRFKETTPPAGVADEVWIGARDSGGVSQLVGVMPDSSVRVIAPTQNPELGYAESTGGKTSSSTAAWTSDKISGLSVTITGTGRPVEIQWGASQLRNSVVGNWTILGLIVNTVADEPFLIISPSVSVGQSVNGMTRKVLTNAVSYTFEVGIQVQGGTTTITGGTFRMWLAVTER